MDKFQSSRQKRISQQQEKNAAKDIGGRLTAGSGAAKFSGGGDVRKAGELRIECKYTEKDYFVLEHKVLKKIQMEALKGGLETPVLQLTFVAKHTGVHTSFAILPKGFGDEDINELSVTDRKRIRLTRAELLSKCLNQGATRVTFCLQQERYESYDITPWNLFLISQEEEEEC